MNDKYAQDPFRKVDTNQEAQEANHDNVFGELNQDGPDYRAVCTEESANCTHLLTRFRLEDWVQPL